MQKQKKQERDSGVVRWGNRRFATLRWGSKEWHAAWAYLIVLTRDADLAAADPETGEQWQYMCTVCRDRRWWHEFRHRHHPRFKRRVYWHVPASWRWKPRDEKVKRRALH